ncbi:hypothetical protein GGR52DRAFT_565401 [Hypoxylon sp. FL1284]|nr:hypothetical protein GGR52DRAFT_565401 [Hypoxylon sp. FL1284]
MAPSIDYKKVLDEEDGDVGSGDDASFPPPRVKSSTSGKYLYSLLALLLVSNICTWYASQWQGRKESPARGSGLSPYAGLAWDYPLSLHTETPFNQPNETLRDSAWDAINIDAGMIAVPQSFVDEKGLPESQTFVWDRSKRVYLLNGHHSLHCARSIYISLMEFKRGQPQSRRWGHILHCVDQLRVEAVCNADDTPRFSTADEIPVTGLHQTRMCRSWDKLNEWARKYTACYRYINQTASYSEVPQVERFVWCPKGSPYIKEVEKVFGHIEWDENGFTISEPEH